MGQFQWTPLVQLKVLLTWNKSIPKKDTVTDQQKTLTDDDAKQTTMLLLNQLESQQDGTCNAPGINEWKFNDGLNPKLVITRDLDRLLGDGRDLNSLLDGNIVTNSLIDNNIVTRDLNRLLGDGDKFVSTFAVNE